MGKVNITDSSGENQELHDCIIQLNEMLERISAAWPTDELAQLKQITGAIEGIGESTREKILHQIIEVEDLLLEWSPFLVTQEEQNEAVNIEDLQARVTETEQNINALEQDPKNIVSNLEALDEEIKAARQALEIARKKRTTVKNTPGFRSRLKEKNSSFAGEYDVLKQHEAKAQEHYDFLVKRRDFLIISAKQQLEDMLTLQVSEVTSFTRIPEQLEQTAHEIHTLLREIQEEFPQPQNILEKAEDSPEEDVVTVEVDQQPEKQVAKKGIMQSMQQIGTRVSEVMGSIVIKRNWICT